MKSNGNKSPSGHTIRERAEQALRKGAPLPDHPQSDADARALLHELQVHQIELHLQNEELVRAQAEAQQAADKYAELFDFGPVGYFILCPLGVIRKLNFAGAALLGSDRQRLTGQPFESFVAPDSRAAFREFWQSVRPGEGRRSCDVRLLRQGRGPCDVLVEATAVESGPGERQAYRLAATDITARKLAEEELRQRLEELRVVNDGLAQFNSVGVDRELRMIELKQEVNALCAAAGQSPRYDLDFGDEPA
jgi:PAS domain S-box-containing protein